MTYTFGWLRDYPDFRDFSLKAPEVRQFLLEESTDGLPPRYDIADHFEIHRPFEQGKLGSCTAHAGVNMYMIYLRVAGLRVEPLSRLFLYKTTRDLLGWNGDTGAHLRTTMQSLAMFGVPPEKYLKYEVDKFDDEPSARLYAMAQNYQALTYYRLDPAFKDPAKILESVKTNIAANRPCIFGFMVYDSIDDKTGNVVMPDKQATRLGGHAVCAVGFDDNHRVPNAEMPGAIKFFNSWGTGWGDKGYGYLPYAYIFKGLAVDWWTMMSAEWLDTKQFE